MQTGSRISTLASPRDATELRRSGSVRVRRETGMEQGVQFPDNQEPVNRAVPKSGGASSGGCRACERLADFDQSMPELKRRAGLGSAVDITHLMRAYRGETAHSGGRRTRHE